MMSSDVMYIDSVEAIARFEAHIEQEKVKDGGGTVVGLDCEWAPSTTTRGDGEMGENAAGQRPRVSLFQIATRSISAVIDMIALHGSDDAAAKVDKFCSKLLTDPAVIKLSFRFGVGDQPNLVASYGEESYARCEPLVEITDFVARCLPGKLSAEVRSLGLAYLAEAVLGSSLDKSLQTSNWESRPLTTAQLEYAARDASVLIDIYDAARRLAWQENGTETAMAAVTSSVWRPLGAKHVRRCLGLAETGDVDVGNAGVGVIEASAAAQTEIEAGTAVKSIGMLVHNQPVVVVLVSGDSDERVDTGAVAHVMSGKKRSVRLAERDKLVEWFGYEPGTLPPFACHRYCCPVIVDSGVPREGLLHCGGGSHESTVVCTYDALMRLSRGTVAAVSHATTAKAGTPARTPSRGHGAKGDAHSSSRRMEFFPSNLIDETGSTGHTLLIGSEISRMARWLRQVGCDAEVNDDTGEDVMDRCQSKIMITRDRKLAARRRFRGILVYSNDMTQIFVDVTRALGIKFRIDRFMADRCSKCNAAGFVGPLSKRELLSMIARERYIRVPTPGVLEKVDTFWVCPNAGCAQVYWEGTKYERAGEKFLKRFENMLLT